MTHLRIELNNGLIEQVGSAVIRKLYELAIEGLDATSNLQGRLHVLYSYRKHIEKLTTDYSNLYITADNYYMSFEDPAVESVFANSLYGDGVGITEANANRFTKLNQSYGFRNNTNVEHFNELSLFVNLKTLDGYTFDGCSNLKTVDISNITSFKESEFKGCSSLVDIGEYPEISYVCRAMFQDCTSLEEVMIPSAVTVLWDYAFNNCTSLTLIGDISNVTEFKASCLRNCNNLHLQIDLSNATEIGAYCFNNSLYIEVTNLPQLECTFGDGPFVGSGITNIVIPSWMTNINNTFFGYLPLLLSITFPQNSNVISIEDNNFRNCPLLLQIIIPEGVLIIGDGLGNTCASLLLIDLPSTVINLGKYISSPSVTTFICRAITPPTLSSSISINGNGKIYVPDQSIADYKAASNWSYHSSKIVGISQL